MPLVALAATVFLASCGGSTSAPETAPTAADPGTSSVGSPSFEVALDVPTPTPKTGERWTYAVTVTDSAGAPIPATITVEVVDPIQQAHPVDYDGTTDPIVDRPVEGRFEDYVIWPPESRNLVLTFRVTVNALGATKQLAYRVTPQ